MSHPARGPIGTMGIDGKAIAARRRRQRGSEHRNRKEAAT
jgi:hypothetical protein